MHYRVDSIWFRDVFLGNKVLVTGDKLRIEQPRDLPD